MCRMGLVEGIDLKICPNETQTALVDRRARPQKQHLIPSSPDGRRAP
jgi:hypothetical protein